MTALRTEKPANGYQLSSPWIRANAGSGKTTELTQQVVRLLLLGVSPERICCITYTKAAAGEMRGRIIRQLRELLLMDDAACRARIVKLTGIREPDAAMLARARTLFGRVLDSPMGGVSLTTIHGFCQQLLRAFPLEAGVPAHFAVADDTQAGQLRAQVKHRLLASVSQPQDVTDAMALMVARSGEARFDVLLRALLGMREASRVAMGTDPEFYRERLYSALGVDGVTSAETLASSVLHCLNGQQKELLIKILPSLLADKGKRKQALGAELARWLEGLTAIEDWVSIWLTDKLTPRADLQKGDFSPGSPLGDAVAYCITQAQRYVQQRAALALAEESFAAAVLAHQLTKLYAQAKLERGLLDYDDLIERTQELLTLTDMVGWVMSKLDHRIDHLLIDEAQDTSAGQWHIARALVEELVATDSGGVLPRSLFVVGDEKQSIYSFQGAEPELYARQENQFSAMLAASAAPMESRALLASYRSSPAILEVVDAVAADSTIAPALSSLGPPPRHEPTRHGVPGEVVLHPAMKAEEKTTLAPFAMPTSYSITRTAAQQLAEQVAAQVAGWIEEGRWTAGDILILTRSRKPIVLPLLRALQRRGVPVAGIDRLVLSSHLAVRDLLALMQWCQSPRDDLALAQVLRSPLLGWSEDELYRHAAPRGKIDLWSAIAAAPAAQTLRDWRAEASRTPYDFLTYILEVAGARCRFARRFGDEVHEILDELKEQAALMPVQLPATLGQFVQWLAGSEREIKRELEAGHHDHVRVMTVHGSKGLEAPLVLMVDTVSLPSLNKEMLSDAMHDGQIYPLLALSEPARQSMHWQQARQRQQATQLAEYQRLLYVAMTRARDALHVFAMEPGRGEMKPECWYESIRRALGSMPGVETLPDGALRHACGKTGPATPARARQAPAHAAMPPWVTQPLPAAAHAAPVLSPSNLAREQVLAPLRVERGRQARERGVVLHRVLQFMTAQMDETQLAALLAHLTPGWSGEERTRAVAEIWALRRREPWLWEHPSQAEVNISGQVEIAGVRYPVLGQIDRLVTTPDAIVVLDYKTGRDVPANINAISESYLLQMKLYKALLETLYIGTPIRCALLWTTKAQVFWVDSAVDALPWNRAQVGQKP